MTQKNYNVVAGFNLIAPAYDLANDAMTLGLHRLWRAKLCKTAARLAPQKGRVLDVATGTGDVLLGILKFRGDLSLTGVDPSEGMLEVAREKLTKKASLYAESVDIRAADARKLPFADNSFDVVTISWGIRNVNPFQEGLREILRVLKPGGSIVVLESGKPEFKPINAAYKYYAKLLPFIGGKISGFMPAYRYYTETVEIFPSGAQFVGELFECGFVKAGYKTLGGSIVYLYTAQKPR
jgi:demethylmenaquinone methyltransferase/2-methoxy-6-polyprenyl-1,4-benzoquinol methylase